MKKKILAAALAVCMTFGSAAALPRTVVDDAGGITVSAQTADSDFTVAILSDGTLAITGYKGNGGTVIVPSEIGGKKVTRIQGTAFDRDYKKFESPTKMIISEGIKFIDVSAIYGCDKLESVELPSSIEDIEILNFIKCSKLKEINVAKGCKNYCSVDGVLYTKDYEWLQVCPQTKTSITIPNGVEYICTYAFWHSPMTSVKLPESLEQIGARAFKGSSIKSLHIPGKVTYISWDAFDECENFEGVTVDSSNGRFSADDGVLYSKDKTKIVRCPGKKKSLTLPNTVRTIGEFAFTQTEIESMILPDSVTSIERWAFDQCSALKSVTLSNNIINIDHSAFSRCDSLKKITIPAGVKTVGESMFYGCTSLESVNIGYGVEKIENEAFFHCTALKSVKIPSSVTSIGAHALGYYDAAPNSSTKYEKVSGFTICGVKGSAAEKYAKEEGFEFEDIYRPVRLAGRNRYETAAVISHNTKNRSTAVILASGEGYADALAGVPLAKYIGSPILLTPKNSLSKDALAEIKQREARKVIILGGEGAVSKNVENALKKEGLKTVRLAGSNRYGTAVEIAKNMDDEPKEVFFVSAGGFADALSAGAAAALKSAPMIYLGKDGNLNADSKAYLDQLGKKGCVKKAYVIGGTGVISDAMMKKAASALGLKAGTTVQRIAGSDRFETCLAVNKTFKSLFTGRMICVSTGLDFPDALAGGFYAAENKAFMLLVGNTPGAAQRTFLSGRNNYSMTVFGGTGAVNEGLLTQLSNARYETKK